jgi:hypothetical protein
MYNSSGGVEGSASAGFYMERRLRSNRAQAKVHDMGGNSGLANANDANFDNGNAFLMGGSLTTVSAKPTGGEELSPIKNTTDGKPPMGKIHPLSAKKRMIMSEDEKSKNRISRVR